ncbi:TPA: hypothetical protein DEG21_02895 [Patescibacteria group bacterium]|nr:hypothetical protein [Candidatus Gracilibacteria bacterium]
MASTNVLISSVILVSIHHLYSSALAVCLYPPYMVLLSDILYLASAPYTGVNFEFALWSYMLFCIL